MTRPVLDLSDPSVFAGWLQRLSTSLADANVVSQDMLRPPLERELGPVLHADNYGEAWKQVDAALAHAVQYAASRGVTVASPGTDGAAPTG